MESLYERYQPQEDFGNGSDSIMSPNMTLLFQQSQELVGVQKQLKVCLTLLDGPMNLCSIRLMLR